MRSEPKKRITPVAIALALAVTAAACSSDADEAATESSPTTSSPATTAAIDEETEETIEADTADTADAGPEAVDLGAFESFALPDYAAAAVGEDYSSYFIEVEPGVNVHVLEVGTGYPVYLQHGAPTSGFLYRKVADLLPPDQFRVIMPTMVGLGFSTKVPAEDHTLENHTRWMNSALTQLELDELIYVGHDWGGPVGIGALERSPELLQGAVVLNTAFGAPTGPVEFNPQLQAILAPLPAEAEVLLTAQIFEQLPGAQNDPSSLSPDVLDLYRRPVIESDNPVGPLPILRMAADGPEHPTAEVLRAIDTYIAQLDIPAEIVWGVNDPLLGGRLDAMMAHFPNAAVTRTEAGHFLQEETDAPEEIAAAIQRIREAITNE